MEFTKRVVTDSASNMIKAFNLPGSDESAGEEEGEEEDLEILRSSDQQLLTIPRARLKLKGDRAFSVAGPKLWNLLPVSIRSAQTISSFKLLLKTYLLTQAFNLSECWVLCSLCLFVCVVLCLCLCIFMKMFFVCCCFLWLFGFLFLYSTLGNNGCIILCYRNKWKKK